MASLHPLQTKTWGKFRELTGVKVLDGNNFVMTVHPIPKTSYFIGYVPKGTVPTNTLITELRTIGKKERCIFIQLEPNVTKDQMANNRAQMAHLGLHPSAHPLFTKYTFILDLSPSEEDLLKNMHQKTRYNIRVAEKKGVIVQEDTSDTAFETFLRLNRETNTRQKFYSHPDSYFRTLRKLLTNKEPHDFSMHLMTASYEGQILVAWILFVCGDTLYYPYGASSSEHREVMASNLMMWETIKFGKKLGLTHFDMWGSLGPTPDTNDSWYGFHRFKQGYGGVLTEFIGSYDLVLNPFLYQIYKAADKLRWLYLRVKK